MPPETLNLYEFDLPPRRGEGLFNIVFLLCIGLFAGTGLYLKTVKTPPPPVDQKKMELIRTQFLIQEKKKEPVKKAAPLAQEAPKPVVKPIDLTKPVILGAKTNDIQNNAKGEVRRVYGLRRVFSMGLGAGGQASDAVVGKLGNTLEKEPDTLTATPQDLKGKLASITTITSMPVMESFVKPEYTDEMKKNKVEGTVSVRLLVDIDGLVKEAVVTNDLGFGTREAVLTAARQLKFKPAIQGTVPMAVWIMFKFKFVLQE